MGSSWFASSRRPSATGARLIGKDMFRSIFRRPGPGSASRRILEFWKSICHRAKSGPNFNSGWSSWKRSRGRLVCEASVQSLFRPAPAAVRICYLGESRSRRIRSSQDPAGWRRSCDTGSITRRFPTFLRGVMSGIPRRPRDRTKVGAHCWTWSWRIANWKTCRQVILVCRSMSYSGIFTRTFPETLIEAKQALTNSGVLPPGTTVSLSSGPSKVFRARNGPERWRCSGAPC